jgi:hypothetical protein
MGCELLKQTAGGLQLDDCTEIAGKIVGLIHLMISLDKLVDTGSRIDRMQEVRGKR